MLPQPDSNNLNLLADVFLTAWRKAHGSETGHAQVLVGSDHLAILIRDSFSRAERKLAQDQSGEVLLRKYAEKLLQQISNEMTDYIEKALGRSVQTNDVNVNPDTDQIMFIFTLEGNT